VGSIGEDDGEGHDSTDGEHIIIDLAAADRALHTVHGCHNSILMPLSHNEAFKGLDEKSEIP
jgi:hypothetical protein